MLHIHINLGVCPETRHVVDLKHPWLEFVVQHNIKAEEIAAEVRLLGLASTIQVLELGLNDIHGFDDYLLHLMPNLGALLLVSLPI